MSLNPRILVTGPTGTVGAPLLEQLRSSGHDVVAAARRPDAVTTGTVVEFDFGRPETFEPALDGVTRVFLMRPPAIADTERYLRPFVEAAQRRGVEHVVFLSVMGVNRVMPHWKVEQNLRSSSLGWTFLRPSFFSQNLETAYLQDIRDRDRIRLPAGNGRTSFVDTRDVAEVAALALLDPAAHRGAAYTLTGPAALGWAYVCSLLSAEMGRPISYESVGFLRYRREMLAQDSPSAYVRINLAINAVARLGLAAKVTDALPTLLKHDSRTLENYVREHKQLWT